MNVTAFEKKEKNTAALTVEVDASAFNAVLDNVYKKMRGQISVPGFRRGKAPRRIIENLYGASVFYSDALDEILPEVCAFGIKEKELRTVGYPSLGDIDVQDDKSVLVQFTVSLYPEIEVGEYKGLHAIKPSVDVPDSAVDAEIESVRLRNASIETVERPVVNGDTVLIDYEGSVDGVKFDGGAAEGYELEIGSNSFIPGFETQIQGMQTGEERDINVTFPEEYHSADLAGKAAVFKVKVHEVRSKVLPEADDEFAKDVSEFDTLDEYKADIRAKLETARQTDADNFFENGILEKLAETVEGDIPEAMYDEQVDNSVNNMRNQLAQYGMDFHQYLGMMGMTEEAFRADSRPSAEKQVKISLALEKVAEKEGLEATEEEVAAFYDEMAQNYQVDLEVVKSSIDEESAKREIKVRAAIKVVTQSGVAEAPAAAEADEGEAKPKKTKKTAAKTEESDGEDSEVKAEAKPKKAPAKKPAASKTAKTEDAADEKTEKKPAAKKPAAKKTTKAKEEEKDQ